MNPTTPISLYAPQHPFAISGLPLAGDLAAWRTHHDVSIVVNATSKPIYAAPVPVLHFPFKDGPIVPRREAVLDTVRTAGWCGA